MKKMISILSVAALSVGLLAGCSGGGSEEAGKTEEKSNEIVIGYASKSSTTPYWVQLNQSIQDVAAEAGIEVKEIGPAKENDVAGQIAIIEDFYSQDVDALIVAACDDVGVAPAVQKFVDAGKPVIAVDNGVQGVEITSLVATDNRASAGAAAEYLKETLGEEFKVVTIDGVIAQGTGRDRKEGFEEKLKEVAPNAEIVNSIAGDWVDDTALKGVEDLLNGNVEFDAIFAAWDGGALVARQALKAAGREDIIVVGHDAFEESCDLMLEDDAIMKGSVAQKPSDMGKLAVETAMKAIDGEEVESFIDSGYVLVTKENAEEYKSETYK